MDVIAELGGDRVIGIEIKAAAAPTAEDARHLRWLKGALGDRLAAAVLLHTGPRAFVLPDGILAAPIGVLWGSPAR